MPNTTGCQQKLRLNSRMFEPRALTHQPLCQPVVYSLMGDLYQKGHLPFNYYLLFFFLFIGIVITTSWGCHKSFNWRSSKSVWHIASAQWIVPIINVYWGLLMPDIVVSTCITSRKIHISLMRWVPIAGSFYRCGNWGSEKLSNLTKTTEPKTEQLANRLLA